jgi:hypothetical protein
MIVRKSLGKEEKEGVFFAKEKNKKDLMESPNLKWQKGTGTNVGLGTRKQGRRYGSKT